MTQIELRAARIPGIIGYLAAHYWFVIVRGQRRDRWEIWQNPDQGGESWSHLHKNLKPFDDGVGHGASWIEREWQGAAADRIAAVIESAPQTYAATERYRYWPGPNSNTFAQWVLQRAGISHRLGVLGIGKGYVKIMRRHSP